MKTDDYQYRLAKLEVNYTGTSRRAKISGNVYGPPHLDVANTDHPEVPIGELIVVRYRDEDQVASIVPDPEGSTRVGHFALEFDPTYAVPRALIDAGLNDVSWHNDCCPSFQWPEDDDGNLRLFSEHPIKELREMESKRFLVTLGDGGGDYDESFETDDVAEAIAKMRELRPRILEYNARAPVPVPVSVPAPAPAPVAPGPASDIKQAVRSLLKDVYSIKGYWTEGLDNSVQRVEAVLKEHPPTPTAGKGPRFVLLIGSIKERFPDVPEPIADGQVVCYDRQEEADVFTIFPKYAQAVCLERINESGPEGLCNWFNGLSDDELISEGMAPAKQAWERPENCKLEQIAEIIRDYNRNTTEDEYTDVGDAWAIFGQILNIAEPKAKPLD